MNYMSVPQVLRRMAFVYKPSTHNQVEGFRGWTGKEGGTLCHYLVVKTASDRNVPTDKIVLLGTYMTRGGQLMSYVMHSILVDANNNIVADSNKEIGKAGDYYEGKGYFRKGSLMYKELTVLPVSSLSKIGQQNAMKQTAKVAPNVLSDAIKTLYIIFGYMVASDANDISDQLINQAKSWLPNTRKLFTQFSLDQKALNTVIKAVYDSSEYTTKVDNAITELGRALKASKKDFDADTSINKEDLQLLFAFASAFTTSSQTAFTKLERSVSQIGVPQLSAVFKAGLGDASDKAEDQKRTLNQIVSLLKKAGYNTKPGEKLSIEDATKLRDKNPELYKQYLKLNRDARDVYKAFVKNLIRASGKPLMDYDKILKELKSAGIAAPIVKGFKGKLDDSYNWYTPNGLKLQSPGQSSEVALNPDWTPDDKVYYMKAKTPAGQSYLFTERYIKEERQGKKAEAVGALEKALPKMRKLWLTDLKRKGPERVLAAQLEIMYTFGARSGTEGATVDKTTGQTIATKGVTGLSVGDVYKKGGSILIKYLGKKAGVQEHLIQPTTEVNRLLIKILTELTNGRTKKEDLWVYDDRTLTKADTVKYWRTDIKAPAAATLHKLRHARGNALAKEVLAEMKLAPGVSQSTAERDVKKAMEKVGEALGHFSGEKVTSATALKNYISPELISDYFTEQLKLRVPSFLKGLI